jgi:hypothetical protein
MNVTICDVCKSQLPKDKDYYLIKIDNALDNPSVPSLRGDVCNHCAARNTIDQLTNILNPHHQTMTPKP